VIDGAPLLSSSIFEAFFHDSSRQIYQKEPLQASRSSQSFNPLIPSASNSERMDVR
jgi:hypothetical protein